MKNVIDFLVLLEDYALITSFVRLVAAAIMGGLIGIERGRHGRPAGLRTHILIAIGAAMSSLTGVYLNECLGLSVDVTRMAAQVISGIGFLGVGTILIRNKSIVTGLTTAAGMWATAAIGISVGFGFYSGAIIATLICIFSVTVLSRLEKIKKNAINIYIELANISDTETVINEILNIGDTLATYEIIPPKSGHADNVGITLTIRDSQIFDELKITICKNANVAMMISEINP
ncbi:MAG: MgtC/SapB family protein [Clostridia bacterium]|nr:MgtC/SapB family protein [Clostridia bacterium]